MGNINQNEKKLKNILDNNTTLTLKKIKSFTKINEFKTLKQSPFSLQFDFNSKIQIQDVNEKYCGIQFYFDTIVKCQMQVYLVEETILQQQSFFFNPKENQKFEITNFMILKEELKQMNKRRPKSSNQKTSIKENMSLNEWNHQKVSTLLIIEMKDLSSQSQIASLISVFSISEKVVLLKKFVKLKNDQSFILYYKQLIRLFELF